MKKITQLLEKERFKNPLTTAIWSFLWPAVYIVFYMLFIAPMRGGGIGGLAAALNPLFFIPALILPLLGFVLGTWLGIYSLQHISLVNSVWSKRIIFLLAVAGIIMGIYIFVGFIRIIISVKTSS